MAVTILDAAKAAANNGEYKRAGVIMAFAEASPLLRVLPVVTVQGNSYTYTREAALPTTAFRAVNAAYTADQGNLEQKTEVLKAAGGELAVDRYLVETNGVQVRTAQERMQATSLAQTIGTALMLGDASDDPREFDGIQTRYGGGSPAANSYASDRVVNAGNTIANSLTKLDQIMDLVDNSIGRKVLVMTQASRRALTAALRNSSSIQTGRDEFGRQIMSYNDLPIIEADPLGHTATMAGEEGGTDTSIYCIALGEAGLHLIQSSAGLSVRDLGEQDSSPVYKTRVEWYVGLVDAHPRCVSRLYNITAG